MWAGESSDAELLLTGLALYGDGLLLHPLFSGTALSVIAESGNTPEDIYTGLNC